MTLVALYASRSTPDASRTKQTSGAGARASGIAYCVTVPSSLLIHLAITTL
jgi:hypothetical protein